MDAPTVDAATASDAAVGGADTATFDDARPSDMTVEAQDANAVPDATAPSDQAAAVDAAAAPDLTSPPDLGEPPDLAPGRDLQPASDLTPSPDLAPTPDLVPAPDLVPPCRTPTNSPTLVFQGAILKCPFGTNRGVLFVSEQETCNPALATIQDFQPLVNIAPFGLCQSLANPQVAAATAATNGVLSPQPCMPATGAPWEPGSSTVTVNGTPALTTTSTCLCSWGGGISIVQ